MKEKQIIYNIERNGGRKAKKERMNETRNERRKKE